MGSLHTVGVPGTWVTPFDHAPLCPDLKFSLPGGWSSPSQPWTCHIVIVPEIFAHLGILGATGQWVLGPLTAVPEKGETKRAPWPTWSHSLI